MKNSYSQDRFSITKFSVKQKLFAYLCAIAFAIMLTPHFQFLSETEKSINAIGALCVFP